MFVNVFVSFCVCKQFYKKTSQPFSPNQYLRIEKARRILCGRLFIRFYFYLSFFSIHPQSLYMKNPQIRNSAMSTHMETGDV